MTQEEYLEKCASVANALAKITKGIVVSREERLKASLDAIEIFYCDRQTLEKVSKSVVDEGV